MFVPRLKRKARTTPTYVSSATVGGNGVTSLSVSLGATVAINDLAIACVVAQNGYVITPPAGWTEFTKVTNDRPSTASTNSMYVFYKYLTAAGSQSTGTFTFSSSDAALAVAVYRGVGGVSVQPVWNINDATIASGFAHRNPETKPGPSDIVVSAVTGYTVLATGATNANPTVPSGFTSRAQVAGGTSGLVKPRSVTIADAPSGDTTGKTWTFANACYTGMVSFCLRGTTRSLADVEELPASLTGLPVYAYGASYHNHVLGGSSANTHSEHITDAIMFRRALRLTTATAASKNFSMGGSLVADQCTLAYGTASEKTEFDPTDATHVNTRAETWLSQTLGGLILWDGLGNDALHDQDNSGADSALRQKGTRNSLNALLRLFRSDTAYIATRYDLFTYAGTWAVGSSTGSLGGLYGYTTTPGDKVTYTATVPHDIILEGFDDTAIGGVGSAYEIRVGGVLLPTDTYNPGTSSNQMKATGVRQNYKKVQLAIPIEGISGATSIEIKHTGSSGQFLFFDGITTRNATPPVIVVNRLGRLSKTTFDALYSGALTYTDAIFDTYSQIASDVAAQFTDGRVIVYDPIASGVFNTSTMIGFDAVHINGAGHAHYWHEILRMLNERLP